jgi:hypothetical protein
MVEVSTMGEKMIPETITYPMGLIEDLTDVDDFMMKCNLKWEYFKQMDFDPDKGDKAEIVWESDENRYADFGDRAIRIKTTYADGSEYMTRIRVWTELIYTIDTKADANPFQRGFYKEDKEV